MLGCMSLRDNSDVDVGKGEALAALVASRTLDVPDFPKPGIVFKDLMPLFADGAVFREVVDGIVEYHGRDSFDIVVGIEARGFLVAAAVALAAGTGVVPVRKAGKLPRAAYSASYALEYGEATLELHRDAIAPGDRVLLVDDVLATGGTVQATRSLVESCGGTVHAVAVLMELGFLPGREAIGDLHLTTLLTV